MDIEDFISEWIDGQCRKFAAEIEEIEALTKYLKDYKKPEPKLRVMPGTEEVSAPLVDEIRKMEAVKRSQTNNVRCRCGDWTYPGLNSCGPNGCYNCPA